MNSKKPQKLARRAYLLYSTSRIIAILLLGLITIIFALLDREPIFLRVASVLMLGAIPAVSIWVSAFVVYKLFMGVNSGQRSPEVVLFSGTEWRVG